MAKYLDQVIKEMGNYSEMGMPDGEGSTGMGTPGRQPGGRVRDVYKLNSLLRRRNGAEQQEDTLGDLDSEGGMEGGMDDYEGGMDGGMEGDGEGDVEQIKSFFTDNPDPSDEEVMQYAEENGMDMQEMRKAVYRLIQSLLPSDEEGMDDYEGMDDEEGDVSMDMDMGGAGGMRGDEEREIRLRNGRRFAKRRRW